MSVANGYYGINIVEIYILLAHINIFFMQYDDPHYI